MKKVTLYLLIHFFAVNTYAQYYLRGEIKNDKNQPLPFARIFIHSLKLFINSGATDGSFGINTHQLYDSLTIIIDDYEPATIKVKTDEWQKIVLKPTVLSASKNPHKLISLTNGSNNDVVSQSFKDDETYFKLVENDFVQADTHSKTVFSLNVNKASYSNVRRFINMSSEVPPDAVRVEELLNYFNLNYKEPINPTQLFNVESKLTSCPWDSKEQLLFINVSAKKIDFKNIPPGNFVFLIDISASMDLPNRLDLIKSAFQLFVKNIRPIDSVSIVTYGEKVEIALQKTPGSDKQKILAVIENLQPAGETPGEMGIKIAYQMALKGFIKGGTNRVILATDGDFNVGESSEKGLEELMLNQRQTGIYLTILGVGVGNLKDSKLQTLAKKGNGNYAYLDDINEAQKVFVKELTQTLYAVADNVSMSVQFNPGIVKKYRLIGFDNKKEAIVSNDKFLEGGEIGSGSSVMAIFEIIPNEKKGAEMNKLDELAKLTLRYKSGLDSSIKKEVFSALNNPCLLDSAENCYQFAAAVTMFGLKLKQSKYFKNGNWSMIELLANHSADKSNHLQSDFLKIIQKTKKAYKEPINRRNKKRFILF